MSLTEALRAGAPQAYAALYDEHAGTLYAYCRVMVGDEAAEVVHDVFRTVAGRPAAAPAADAGLPGWLHALAHAECVRRGAFVRGVVTTSSADPLRRALALLAPEQREVLALSNALIPHEIGQVLDVPRDTAERLVREARRRLEQAIVSVSGGEALAALDGAALQRLVTLGYEPPAELREQVLSPHRPPVDPTAHDAGGPVVDDAGGPTLPEAGGPVVFDAAGTPLPPDAFTAQADDATHQFPRISPDEPATAPMRPVDGIAADAPPDRFGSVDAAYAEAMSAQAAYAEAAFAESGLAELGLAEPERADPALANPTLADAGLADPGIAHAQPAAGRGAGGRGAGGQPPSGRGTHAKQPEPFLGRLLLPVVALVACAAVVTGAVLAWPGSHHAHRTSALLGQSPRPSGTAWPSPSEDQATPLPRPTTSSASPTPTRTAAAPPARASAPARGSRSATSAPRTEPARPTATAGRTPSASPAEPSEPSEPSTPATPPGGPWDSPPTWPTTEPTTRPHPRPHHSTAPADAPGDAPGGTYGTRGCQGAFGQEPGCGLPGPWHSQHFPRS